MRRWCWLLVGGSFGILAACPSGTSIPGERIGVFDFEAFWELDGGQFVPPSFNECFLEEVPNSFHFEAVLSRNPDPGSTEAWITLGPISNRATFDGQYVQSYASAPRKLDECTCPESNVLIDERITVALLSKSQRDALGQLPCPENPLDGGVPRPDGGVILPGPTPNGFDALLACGELINTLTSVPPCLCTLPDAGELLLDHCQVGYRLNGARR